MYLTKGRTDWLGARPIFYNIRTNRISENINELIEPEDAAFHPEGLRNYLEYGYCVFGQTPLKNIRFLESNNRIYLENGKIKIQKLEDPIWTSLGITEKPEDTLEYIRFKINQWEKQKDEKVIIPTSSGFDSRLIDSMLQKKSNAFAFTYGISENQNESIETVYASSLCSTLGIAWKQIELNSFMNYFDAWNQLYGIATHAHGMYQMEFYDKIAKEGFYGSRMISGIYGDLWAGNWKFEEVEHPKELSKLSISHGIMVDSSYCRLPEDHALRDEFFERNRDYLKSQEGRIILAARMKIILLSYLLRVPEFYGFESWSPFIESDVVSRMLNLDWKEKERRRWQIEYFRNRDLLIGERKLKCDKGNTLDETMARNHSPFQLDVKLLSRIIDEPYLEFVNRKLCQKGKDLLFFYNIYTVLYPLEQLLKRKDG